MEPIAEEEQERYGRYFAKGASITFVGLIIIAASQFGLRVFLAQGLSKANFGLLFAIITFVGFFNTLSHLGLNHAVTKFVSKFKAEDKPRQVKSSIFSSLAIVAGVSLLVSVIIIVLSNFLAQSYFGSPGSVPIIIVLSVWFFLMSFHSFLLSTLQGFKDMLGRSLGQVIRSLVPFIGVVGFVLFFNLDLTSATIFYLLGPIFSVSLMLAFLKRRHSKFIAKASDTISKPLAKKMLSFGLPLILSGTAISIIGRTDTLMLTGLRSLGDVGLYQVARLTKPVLTHLGVALAIPLFPMISELWAKKDMKALRNTVNLLLKFSFILIIPVALVVLTFPGIIIRLFFGAKYLAAVNAMRVLSVFTIFWTVTRIFSTALKGIGKTTLILKAFGTAAIFNIPANLLLIPLFGATGAAAATGMAFLVGFIISFYYARKEIKFSIPSYMLTKIGLGGTSTLLLITFLKMILPLSPWIKLFAILVLSALFYLVWLFGTKIITEKDLDVIEASVPIPRKVLSILKKLTRSKQ